jgi:cold shock CspA family protein
MFGTVSNVISAKGFGFISGENGQEYFFHQTETVDWDVLCSTFANFGGGKIRVFFEPSKTPKGPRASKVTIVD